MIGGPLTVPYLLGCQTQRVAYLRCALNDILSAKIDGQDADTLARYAAHALRVDDAARPITDEVSP